MYVRVTLPPYLRQISFTTSLPFIHTLIDANMPHIAVQKDGNLFHNSELAQLYQPRYTTSDIEHLTSVLIKHGTIEPQFINDQSVYLDEKSRPLCLLPATAPRTYHGDMSNILYLRDQIQTAELFLKLQALDPQAYKQEGQTGKRLLLSALHLMSTPSQLARLKTCIDRYATGATCGQADWPQISLAYASLDGVNANGWRNIQDTMQMLGYTTLIALEQRQLQADDLLASHKQFLGGLVPLIVSAGFPLYENSGTWEEVAARRTSVMSIETAFLSKLFDVRLSLHRRNYAFFASEYQIYRRRYPQLFSDDFDELLATKVQEGLQTISERLPFESPGYERQSIKYRTSDAALVYVLRYHIPELLVRFGISVSGIGDPLAGHLREEQIENLVLAQIDTLRDREGYGIFRYHDDSYQRVNWGTDEVQMVVRDIKRFIAESATSQRAPADYDLKQLIRHQLTPKGRQAAWSLAGAHLAMWAAERFLQQQKLGQTSRAEHYNKIATRNLNQTLSLVTGDSQWASALSAHGTHQLQSVPSWQLPECYVTYKAGDRQAIVPSAHTPLNWTSSLLRSTLGHMHAAAAIKHP